ncbi:DUF6233 domain-containing protein [Streptomyces sp. NPDC057908]|uniref:DUF6233 domain-containing protein n=1 Tax=Streptomyces sp. NPDC057908 TaxID=3346276 RepID=UPI0036E1B08C
MPGPEGISDLDKNRTLEQWLVWQLRQVRNRVRELEIREQQELRARQRARAEQSWKIQPRRSGEMAVLHRGGCGLYKSELGYLTRDEAIIALAEPDIEPCQICTPQTGLVDG